jgi:hypothetical protein
MQGAERLASSGLLDRPMRVLIEVMRGRSEVAAAAARNIDAALAAPR